MKRIKLLQLLTIAGIAALYSCGGEKKEAPSTVTPESPTSMVETPANPVETTDNSVTVHLTGDDQMKYNVNAFSAKEGQTITIHIKNIGTMPADAMAHNFILLKPGTVVAEFAEKAIGAKDNHYFPESEKASVIAHTKMVGPGESDTISFKAPAPGKYEYICSFPGHYGIMKGILTVE